ncbi:hypothetical protein [Ursidibacter arcticus]
MNQNHLNKEALTQIANYRLLRALRRLNTNSQQQILATSGIDYALVDADLNDNLAVEAHSATQIEQALALLQPTLTANQKTALEQWAEALDEQREQLSNGLTEYQDALFDTLTPIILAYLAD